MKGNKIDMKRSMIIFSTAAMLLSLGCGKTGGDVSPGTESVSSKKIVQEAINNAGNPVDLSPEEDAVIELTFWEGSPTDEEAWNTVLGQLESDYPEITIIRQKYPAKEYRDVMAARISTGDWPDVMRYQYQYVGQFKSQDVLLDLSPYMTAENLEDFSEGFLAGCIYDEKIVALPQHTDVIAMFYNKRMFEKADIRIPEGIDDAYSWDELKEIARKVKEENKLVYAGTGIWQNNLGYRYLPFVYMNGGALLNEDQTKVAVDSDEFREAVNFYKEMRDENLFTDSGFTGPQEANDLFSSEQVAFDFAGSWHCSYIEEKMPGNWGVTYMPQKDGRTGTDMGGNAIFCCKNTEYPKAAAIVAQYLTDADIMKTFCEIGDFIPVRKSLLNSKLSYVNYPEEMELFQEMAQTLDPKMASDETSEHFTELNIIFGENMDKIVFDRSATASDVVDGCKKEMEEVLKGE